VSLPYRTLKIATQATKAIGETRDIEAKVMILTDALTEMAAHINLENRRIADAVNSAGGQSARWRTVTSAGDITSVDGSILGDTTAGAFTMTLPPATEYPGMIVRVKKQTGGPALSVGPRGSDTINGGGSVVVTSGTLFQSDGVSNWFTF